MRGVFPKPPTSVCFFELAPFFFWFQGKPKRTRGVGGFPEKEKDTLIWEWFLEAKGPNLIGSDAFESPSKVRRDAWGSLLRKAEMLVHVSRDSHTTSAKILIRQGKVTHQSSSRGRFALEGRSARSWSFRTVRLLVFFLCILRVRLETSIKHIGMRQNAGTPKWIGPFGNK